MAPLDAIVMAEETPSPLPGLPGFNPNNLQPWTVQVVAAMTVLAFVCVVLRIISRRIRQQELWWDDRMIIFSMVGSLDDDTALAFSCASGIAEQTDGRQTKLNMQTMTGLVFRCGWLHLRHVRLWNGSSCGQS